MFTWRYTLLLLLLIGLFLGNPPSIYAQSEEEPPEGCGWWNNTTPPVCTKAIGSYDLIEPYERCLAQNPNFCCPQGSGLCETIEIPDAPPEDPTDYPRSDKACGVYYQPPGSPTAICIEENQSTIYQIKPAFMCPDQYPKCCISREHCGPSWSCSTDYQCTQGDPGLGTWFSESDCEKDCVAPTPTPTPPPSDPVFFGKIKCEDEESLNTAIGCIPITTIFRVASFLVIWMMGVGGAAALILMIAAGFQIMTSQGNPRRLLAGRELVVSVITGAILLVLSIFIVRVIQTSIFP